jgi:hypothetical protein
LLVGFAVGLAATSLLTWLGSYGGKAAAVALANLAAAAAANVGLFLLVFRVLTPRQIPTRQLVIGALVAGVAWQALQAAGGFWSATTCVTPARCTGCSRSFLLCCLVVSGRAGDPVRRRTQRRGRPTALTAQPAAAAVGQRRPTRPS